MDIALLSMALSQGQVQQQASMSVMKATMEQAIINPSNESYGALGLLRKNFPTGR